MLYGSYIWWLDAWLCVGCIPSFRPWKPIYLVIVLIQLLESVLGSALSSGLLRLGSFLETGAANWRLHAVRRWRVSLLHLEQHHRPVILYWCGGVCGSDSPDFRILLDELHATFLIGLQMATPSSATCRCSRGGSETFSDWCCRSLNWRCDRYCLTSCMQRSYSRCLTTPLTATCRCPRVGSSSWWAAKKCAGITSGRANGNVGAVKKDLLPGIADGSLETRWAAKRGVEITPGRAKWKVEAVERKYYPAQRTDRWKLNEPQRKVSELLPDEPKDRLEQWKRKHYPA